MTTANGAESLRSELKRGLPDLPMGVDALPVDERGYPVPWFVAWIDGAPDFRVIDPEKYRRAVVHKLCWVCGRKLGRSFAFLIGPMCAITRTSGEPPMHTACGDFSARACPFLTLPKAERRSAGLPDDITIHPAGLARNPGVALLWMTKHFSFFPDGQGGKLIEVGDPTSWRWYAEGREATRSEIMESIESGLPILESSAQIEGPDAMRDLRQKVGVALAMVTPEYDDEEHQNDDR